MFAGHDQWDILTPTSATVAPAVLPPTAPLSPSRDSFVPWRALWQTRGRRVVLLLAAVWVLNLLDLHFTLFESPRQHFVELNPVAASLLGISTFAAIVYKLVLVAGATAILLVLRRHRLAEWSSWLSLGLYTWVAACWSMYFTVMPADVPAYWPPLLAAS
ncbi:MAG: hypothetical protein JXO22_01600 [Phycisphaerae bacterium]|nr:hypothetical protein [Phycisphaerae bacterium]